MALGKFQKSKGNRGMTKRTRPRAFLARCREFMLLLSTLNSSLRRSALNRLQELQPSVRAHIRGRPPYGSAAIRSVNQRRPPSDNDVSVRVDVPGSTKSRNLSRPNFLPSHVMGEPANLRTASD